MHSCIKIFINFRERYSNPTHTTEHVDNAPLRYASVISHACIALVLVASSKRQSCQRCVRWGFGCSSVLLCTGQKRNRKVCDANGARSAHVGLEYALCLRCMCLIEALTRCGAFPVPQFTLVLSSHVGKESACSCLCCCSAKVGLRKTLRLVWRCAVRHSLSAFCRKQDKGSMHDKQCINRLGPFIIRRTFV